MSTSTIDIDALIDDRPSEGVFRVRREVFYDPAIFDLEMRYIFEGTWLFIGLESQVAKPHDFLTTALGRQPVLVMRDGAGRLGCYLNSCRHRGALLCPLHTGNRKHHVCAYHGWAYDSAGRNVAVTEEKDGRYPACFTGENRNLVPVPRFANYRGLLFASLSADVPSIEDHLGEARVFVDMLADQSTEGLEFVPGAVSYTFDGNWKLQIENGLDFYHFSSTHRSYLDLVERRRKAAPEAVVSARWVNDEPVGQGTFSFAHGHGVMWSNRNSSNAVRPLAHDPQRLEALRQRVGHTRAKWMLYNRNLTLYPNVQIVDIASLHVRILRPLAVDKTEMISHCLAPIGESAEARRRRIRQYEDFFNPSGLATPDDNVMYENCQAGFTADAAGWTLGYLRGLGEGGAPDGYAKELGIAPDGAAYGGISLGDETCLHAGYREWRRLLKRGLETR